MPFTVEAGIENYRLVGPSGEEGETVPYEGIAAIKIGSHIYYCDASDDPDSEDYKVYRVTECQEVDAILDDGVVFDGETVPEGEDEPGDEEDEDEEEEEVGPELVK